MSVVPPSAPSTEIGRLTNQASGRRWFYLAEALVLVFCVLALLAAAVGPQRLLNHSYVWAPADGNELSAGRARELLWLARVGAMGAIAIFAIGIWRRPAIEAFAARAVGELGASLSELRGSLRRELASFPGVAWVSLALVTILGAAVRIRYVFEPLRYDEAFTYCTYAARPMRAFLQDYSWPNNHLFHTILVHASTRLFGPEPWAIRLPALVAGILTIPVAGLLFGRMFNVLAGVLAAAFVAASTILIEYSVNARGYSIQVLIFLLLLATALYVSRRRGPAGWLALVVLAAVGFFTIPTTLYPFGIVLAWLVLLSIFAPDRQPPGRVVAGVFVAGLATVALAAFLYSPIILYHGIKPLTGNQFVVPLTRSQWIHGLPLALRRIWSYANRGLPLGLGALLAAGAVAGLLVGRGERRREVLLLVVSLALCPLLAAAQRVIPFTRVWVFLEPVYLGLAAAGFAALATWGRREAAPVPRWAIVVLPVASMIVLGAFALRSGLVVLTGEAFPQAAELARYFEENVDGGDRILAIFPAEAPLRYQALSLPRLGRAIASRDPRSARLFIVVRPFDPAPDPGPVQTPDEVPRALGVATAAYGPPRLVHSASGIDVYEMRRLGS